MPAVSYLNILVIIENNTVAKRSGREYGSFEFRGFNTHAVHITDLHCDCMRRLYVEIWSINVDKLKERLNLGPSMSCLLFEIL